MGRDDPNSSSISATTEVRNDLTYVVVTYTGAEGFLKFKTPTSVGYITTGYSGITSFWAHVEGLWEFYLIDLDAKGKKERYLASTSIIVDKVDF